MRVVRRGWRCALGPAIAAALIACSSDEKRSQSADPGGDPGTMIFVTPPADAVDNLHVCGRYGIGRLELLAASEDGNTLAVGGLDMVALFHRPDGAPLRTWPVSGDQLLGLDVSADGSKVAVMTRLEVDVYDATSGALLQKIAGPFLAELGAKPVAFVYRAPTFVRFSPDGTRLAIGTDEGYVSLRELGGGEQRVTPANPDFLMTAGAAFSPDGKSLLVHTKDGATVFDATSGAVTGTIDTPTMEFHGGVAAGPDGLLAVAGTDDIRVSRSGAVVATLVMKDAVDVAFSSDGKRLAAASGGPVLRVWDLATGGVLVDQVLQTKYNEGTGFPGVRFSADGETVLVTSAFQALGVKVADGTHPETYGWGVRDRFTDAALSPDRRFVATAGLDSVVVWNRTESTVAATLPSTDAPFEQVAFSPDSRFLYSAAQGVIAKWDTGTWTLAAQNTVHRSMITELAVSPDGSKLLAGIMDNEYMVVAADTLMPLLHTPTPQSFDSLGAFTEDGAAYVGAKTESVLSAWDARTGAEMHSLDVHQELSRLLVVPSAHRLAVASDGTLRFFDWPSFAPSNVPKVSSTPFYGLAPAGDRFLLALSYDVSLWDVGAGKPVSTGTVDGAYALHIPLPKGLSAAVLLEREGAARLHCNDENAPATYIAPPR